MPGSGGMGGRTKAELGYLVDGEPTTENKGGNWKIFEAMLNASGAKVRLGTNVGLGKKNDDDTWTLSSVTKADNEEDSQEVADYDEIILAAPMLVVPALTEMHRDSQKSAIRLLHTMSESINASIPKVSSIHTA